MEKMTKENYKEIFEKRDVDEDTKIKSLNYSEVEGVFMAEERWYWDGICGSSLIVYTPQLKQFFGKEKLSLNECYQYFIKISGKELIPHKTCTLKAGEIYTYFNFDFVTD